MDEPTRQALGYLIERLQPQAAEYCFLWINWWPLCMTKSEWSGWAQFVGTVLAILGSFAVAMAIERRAARHAQQHNQRKALAFLRFLGSLIELGPPSDLVTVKLQQSLLQQQIASAQAIDAERLNEAQAVAVYSMRMIAQRFMHIVDEHLSLIETFDALPPSTGAQHAASYAAGLRSMRKVEKDFMAAYGLQ